MIWALRSLWWESRRYLPAVLAVAFSGLLIAMQVGLLIGLIGVVSVPIENAAADIWVMYPHTPACDLARPIPRYWAERVWSAAGVTQVDEYIQTFGNWRTLAGTTELAILVGCNLDADSLGPVQALSPHVRTLLTEPMSVALDERDAWRLDISRLGQEGEINGQRVRVVAFVRGMGSISGPFVVCSLATARRVARMRQDQTTYFLAKCRDPRQAPTVAAELDGAAEMTAYTADGFSRQSQWHWIRKTKAGIALGFAALLGLAVGASITSQTLYAAVAASLKELAVLRALGIPHWRMSWFVLQQAADEVHADTVGKGGSDGRGLRSPTRRKSDDN